MKGLTAAYKHILETMQDGVLAISREGRIVLYNEASATIFGRPRDESMGMLLMEFFDPDDAENDEFIQVILDSVYEKREPKRISVPFHRADGKTLHLEISSIYMDQAEGQEFAGVVQVFTDVTHLRELYEKEKEISSRLGDAYVELENKASGLQSSIKSKRIKWRVLAWLALAVFVLAGGALALQQFGPSMFSGGESAADRGELYVPARKKDLSTRLSLVGRIEPLEIVNIVSPFAGRVQEIFSAPGQAVHRGEPLLRLDVSELEIKVREAESKWIKAQQEYEKVRNWNESDEVSLARRDFVKGKTALATSQDKFRESADLLERGVIPRDEYESLKLEMENRKLDFTSSQEKLRSTLERGSEEYVRIAKIALDNAQFDYERLLTQRENAVICAPVDGLVLEVKKDSGKSAKAVEIGASFAEGEAIFALGNMEGLAVRSQADELDIVKLSVSQSATITGDAFPDIELAGAISEISAQAASMSQKDEPAVYDVLAEVPEIEDEVRKRLRVGMMATMQVTTYVAPEAVVVPIDAVDKDAAGPFVRVRGPEGPVRRAVEPGVTTLSEIEIRQGLAPGEEVLLSGGSGMGRDRETDASPGGGRSMPER